MFPVSGKSWNCDIFKKAAQLYDIHWATQRKKTFTLE